MDCTSLLARLKELENKAIGSLREEEYASALQLVEEAVRITCPCFKNSIFQILCRLSLRLEKSLVSHESIEDKGIEGEILKWISQMVDQDGTAELSRKNWEFLRAVNSWAEVFFEAAEKYTLHPSFHSIFTYAIEDFKWDFDKSFRLFKLCYSSGRGKMAEKALQTCVGYSVQDPSDYFKLVFFLEGKSEFREFLITLSRHIVLSDSKETESFRELLKILVKEHCWEIGIACAYRLIGLLHPQQSELRKDTAAELVRCYLELLDPVRAAESYRKFWYNEKVSKPFPYAGSFVRALHALAPHSELIRHICDHLDQKEHSQLLDQGSPWARLLEAKRLEFSEKWNEALKYWQMLYDETKDKQWLIPVSCFVGNHGLIKQNNDALYFAITQLKDLISLENTIYRRIILIFKACKPGELSDDQLLSDLRIEYASGGNVEEAQLLPPEGEVFSEYLVPRVLEALLRNRRRADYIKNLKNTTGKRLPKYGRQFIEHLIEIDRFLEGRTQIFTKDEAWDFLYQCRSALKIPINDNQLHILTARLTEADRHFEKNRFGECEDSDITHLLNVLVWRVAYRAEELYKQNLTGMSGDRRDALDADIRNMTFHTAAKTLNVFLGR